LGDVGHTLSDFSQANLILGWRPQVSIEDGVAELLQLHESDSDRERSHVA
jgi:nucleoside-diphosphate-sugar epimerase